MLSSRSRSNAIRRYRRKREYPHPPPPSTNKTRRTTNRVIISHLSSIQCSADWRPKLDVRESKPELLAGYYASNASSAGDKARSAFNGGNDREACAGRPRDERTQNGARGTALPELRPSLVKTGSPTRMNPVFEAVRAGKVPPAPASFGKFCIRWTTSPF